MCRLAAGIVVEGQRFECNVPVSGDIQRDPHAPGIQIPLAFRQAVLSYKRLYGAAFTVGGI